MLLLSSSASSFNPFLFCFFFFCLLPSSLPFSCFSPSSSQKRAASNLKWSSSFSLPRHHLVSSFLPSAASVVEATTVPIEPQQQHQHQQHDHVIAVLSYPTSSHAKVCNTGVVTEALMAASESVSIIITADSDAIENTDSSSLQKQCSSSISAYLSELYSLLWEIARQKSSELNGESIIDVIVYPPLPNIAHSQSVHLRPEISAIYGSEYSSSSKCSISATLSPSDTISEGGDGKGGFRDQCNAINSSRREKDLPSLVSISVTAPPGGVPMDELKYIEEINGNSYCGDSSSEKKEGKTNMSKFHF